MSLLNTRREFTALLCRGTGGTDLKAFNTFERPALVAPRVLEAPRPGPSMTFRLPARSYSVVHLATT
jgi:hypothetical protein